MTVISWTPERVQARVMSDVEHRMDRAVTFLRDEVKRAINIGNPTGREPSAPGEPPRKVTSRLFHSMAKAVVRTPHEVIGAYGSNVEYSFFLELGTRKMAPRPHLRPALQKNRSRVLRFFQ